MTARMGRQGGMRVTSASPNSFPSFHEVVVQEVTLSFLVSSQADNERVIKAEHDKRIFEILVKNRSMRHVSERVN